MKNTASILGLVLPSFLCVGLTFGLKQDLRTNHSGEAAANLIVGGAFVVVLLMALSCVLNLVLLAAAARRKEPMWKLATLGIPLCVVLTTLTVLLIR